MIARYTRPAMGRIWSDQNKFQQWLEVELAAAEALAELGTVRPRRRACCALMPASTWPHSRNRARGEARRDRLHTAAARA